MWLCNWRRPTTLPVARTFLQKTASHDGLWGIPGWSARNTPCRILGKEEISRGRYETCGLNTWSLSTFTNTSVFSAEISRSICATLCTDVGADANILASVLLYDISKKRGEIQKETLTNPSRISLAANLLNGFSVRSFSDCTAQVDVNLHICHRASLNIWNVYSLVLIPLISLWPSLSYFLLLPF